MASDTRELLLDRAEALFAERGFYGVSIAAIANELGLTKQALLHHYGSKEKLYGEVLRRISEKFDRPLQGGDDPITALTAQLLHLHRENAEGTSATRVLMRELLDNKRRADTAGTWYLKPFLEQLTLRVKAIPAWAEASDAEAFAVVYQLLGAINYFGISEPTLKGIYGAERYEEIKRAFPAQLEALIAKAVNRRS